MQSVTIGSNQAGQRLDKFLRKYLPNAGAGFLYKMLRKKNITLNGKKAEGSELLTENDIVRFFFSDETFSKFLGVTEEDSHLEQRKEEGRRAFVQLHGITVLYEDEDILIVNKPPEILTQKAAAGDSSLNEWLVGYLLKENPSFERALHSFRPSVCNRLDRNTSGIVLCGKSLAGSQYLSGVIREREVRKFYRTICVGRLDRPQTTEGFLVKDARTNRVTVKPSGESPSGDAAPIRTAYVPLAWTKGYSLLEVELITGKPHQIRAHLASIGHPLIGDFKYGSPKINRELKERYGLGYQLLHACRVEFPLREEGAGRNLSGRTVCAPCPEAFETLGEALGLRDVSSRRQ